MEGFGGGRVNHSQNKRERAIKRLKRFTGPAEKREETVMLIMCARQTPRAKEKETDRERERFNQTEK